MKINRKKTIFDVLYSKQAFLNNENIGFKNPQNWHFSKEGKENEGKIGIFAKGIVHDFGQKWKFFHVLCLSKIDGEKVFADVLDIKEPFKDYKNNCLWKTQN